MGAELNEQVQLLERVLSERSKCAIRIHKDAKQNLSKAISRMRSKWLESGRKLNNFLNKNREWLDTDIAFPADSEANEASTRGRPSLEFAASSERSKRRKTEELRQSHTAEELCYAAQMSLRSSGEVMSSKKVKDVITPAPLPTLSKTQHTPLSIDEALSVIVEAKLTKHQYNVIRNSMKKHNCHLYPSYDAIREAKASCYPPRSSISVTESSAEVKLQDLLDHTCKRIIVSQEVLKSGHIDKLTNAELICKWGCDGSSGQGVYKQKFQDDNNSDANIFLTSLVPLQLTFFESESGCKVLWKNPRPSSPRYCRPIRMQFLHENTESTVNEKEYIEEQISSLKQLKIGIDGREVTVTYKMLFTMIDGKVCNAVTSTKSAQRCYLCGATSKEFNDIDAILKREVKEENLKFGMSTLHAWIRFFESLLHLSYKLDLKKWQARTGDEKKMVSDRKAQIQKSLKSELGLIVDRPKPGYGSTNDGNTARRFFENCETTSVVTGLDEDLIKRFHAILQAISSGYEINVDNFKEYALETARLYVRDYSWYYMPTTVHKILIHGPLIIASALLPIGQLSEEAQEARNKDVKKFRDGFSRKSSRENTMQDVLNWLLVSSDPFITNLRQLPPKKYKQMSPEANALLAGTNTPAESQHVYPDSD